MAPLNSLPENGSARVDARGLAVALGTGVSCERALVRSHGAPIVVRV